MVKKSKIPIKIFFTMADKVYSEKKNQGVVYHIMTRRTDCNTLLHTYCCHKENQSCTR